MRKEEIRNDPVRENIIKGVEYIKNNFNNVLKIFAMLIVLMLGLSYYNNMKNIQFENSSNIAGLAQNIFINGNIDEALVKFERVLNDYPSTSGATQSLIYLLNDAITKEDYHAVSNLLSQFSDIKIIDDPILQSSIFKIKGDIAFIDREFDKALSFYKKAEKFSKGTSIQIKYKLDVISTLLTQEYFIEARNMLEDILDNKTIDYNEKNIAEELLAFVNYKLNI